MRRGAGRWVVAVAAFGLVGGGLTLARRGSGDGSDGARYGTAPVTRGEVRSSVTATGVIQPWKVVDVKPDVGGRITRLAVDLGDHVRSGQLIALIDPTDSRAAAQQAEADLTGATAKREQAEADWATEDAAVPARVEAAQRSLEAAQAKEAGALASTRAQPALTNAAISQADAAVAAAQKSLVQAQQAKSQLEQQLAEMREVTAPLNAAAASNDLNQAKANMETAAADYRRQEQLLGRGYASKSDVEVSRAKMATAQASEKTAEQRDRTMIRENELSIREVEARIAQAASQIEVEQGHVKQAEAALDLARENRVQDQLRQQDYEAARAGTAQARADLATAQADQQQIVSKQKDIVAAQAQIVRDQASVEQAKTNLSYTQVLAPRDGVVVSKNVEEGTVVPSSRQAFGSTSALVQIGDISRLWVVCNVDETDISQVRQGQRAAVKMDAYPNLHVEGTVIRIDPQSIVQQNVTMIPVTVQLSRPDARFKPGMNARCEFETGEAGDVLRVPNEAVKPGGRGGAYVLVLEKGKPQRVRVQLGLAGQEMTEIRSGLVQGQQVVTRVIAARQPAPQTNNPLASPMGAGGRGPGRGR